MHENEYPGTPGLDLDTLWEEVGPFPQYDLFGLGRALSVKSINMEMWATVTSTLFTPLISPSPFRLSSLILLKFLLPILGLLEETNSCHLG